MPKSLRSMLLATGLAVLADAVSAAVRSATAAKPVQITRCVFNPATTLVAGRDRRRLSIDECGECRNSLVLDIS